MRGVAPRGPPAPPLPPPLRSSLGHSLPESSHRDGGALHGHTRRKKIELLPGWHHSGRRMGAGGRCGWAVPLQPNPSAPPAAAAAAAGTVAGMGRLQLASNVQMGPVQIEEGCGVRGRAGEVGREGMAGEAFVRGTGRAVCTGHCGHQPTHWYPPARHPPPRPHPTSAHYPLNSPSTGVYIREPDRTALRGRRRQAGMHVWPQRSLSVN